MAMSLCRRLFLLLAVSFLFGMCAGCGSSTPVQPVSSRGGDQDDVSEEAAPAAAPAPKVATKEKGTNTESPGPVKPTEPVVVPQTAISPDAKWLATINADGTIRYFDVSLGQLKRSFPSPFLGVTALAVDQAGQGIIVGNSQGQLHQLVTSSVDGLDQFQQRDALQKSLRPIHAGHTGDITAVEFSDNERLLGSLGKDGTVRLWFRNAAPPTASSPLDLAVAPQCLALRPSGASMLIGTATGIVEVGLDGKAKLGEATVEGGVIDISTLPDGRVVVCTGRNRAAVLNSDLSSPEGESRSDASTGDGKVVTVRGTDSGYWTVQSDGLIRDVAIDDGSDGGTLVESPLASAFPTVGRSWVGQLRDGQAVSVAQPGQAAEKLPLAPTLQKPTAMAVSADGGFAVAGDSQGVANLVDLRAQALSGQVTVVPGRRLEELAVSTDGRFLAATADRKVFLTEWKGGGTRLSPPEPGSRIVTTGGSRVVAIIGSRRNEVSFLDLDNPEAEPVRHDVADGRVALVTVASGKRWLIAREDGQVDRLSADLSTVDASVRATSNRPVALLDTGDELIVADSAGSIRGMRWNEPDVGRKSSLVPAETTPTGSPVLSLNGDIALVPADNKLIVRTTSGPSGKTVVVPTGSGGTASSLDPEGRSVAWLDKSGAAQARTIDPVAGTVGAEFSVKGSVPWATLAIGDQGRLLATAAKDGVANIWRTRVGGTAVGWSIPRDAVAVDQSPDGLRVLVVSATGVVQAGEVASKTPSFNKTFGPCTACWSRDGKGIVVASRTAVEYFNAVSAASEGAVRVAILDPQWIRTSGTGRRFWVGATDGSIRQIDLAEKKVLKDWPALRGEIRRYDSTATRLLILTKGEAIIRETESDDKDLRLSVGDVADAAFSSDGSLLATLATTGKLRIWQILKKSLLKEVETGISPAKGLGRSAENGWWNVLGSTGEVALIDWQGQLIDRTPAGSLTNLRANSPLTDEGLLVATESGLHLLQSRLHSRARVSSKPISSLSFAGARYLAAADVEGQLWLWDLDKRALVRSVGKLPSAIQRLFPAGSAAFGVVLADGSARIVPAVPSRKIVTCQSGGDVTATGIDTAGKTLACATSTGKILLFETATGQPVEEISGARLADIAIPTTIGVSADASRLTLCDDSGTVLDVTLRARFLVGSAETVTGLAMGPSTGPANGPSTPLFWMNARGQLHRFPGSETPSERITIPAEKVLALRRDAEVLLASEKQGGVALLEVATGKSLVRRDMPAIRSAKFSESEELIACELDSGVMEVVSAQTLQTVRRHVPSKAPGSYGLVDDPGVLVTTLTDGTLELIDLRETEATVSRQWDVGATALAFSADGARLYAALGDQSIVAWDIATGAEQARWQTHGTQPVSQLLLTKTGLLALTGKQLFHWPSLEKPEANLIRLSSAAMWMAVSPDGSRLLVGGASSAVGVIDLGVGNVIAEVTLPERDAVAGRWGEGGGFSVVTQSGKLHDRGVPVRTAFNIGLTNVTQADVAVSARIAVAANDREVVWFSTAGQPMGRFEPGLGRLTKVALSPDGRYLVLLSRAIDGPAGRLRVVNTADSEEVGAAELPGVPVDIAFRDDAGHCLVGLENGQLAEVDFLAGRVDEAITVSSEAVRPAIAADGGLFWVSASGKVGLASATSAGIVDCDGGVPRSFDFCLNDSAVLVGLADGRLVVWSVVNQKRIGTVKLHANSIDVVRVHKTSPLVVTADAKGELRVWALEQLFAGAGELKPSIVCNHRAAIRDAWLDPDAPRALSCGTDGSIKVWDLAEGKEVRRLGDKSSSIVKFAPGPIPGHTITVGADSYARVWDYVSKPDGKPEDTAVREIAIHASREELLARMTAGREGTLPPELQSQLDLLKQEQAAAPRTPEAARDNAVAAGMFGGGSAAASAVDPGITLRRQKLETELRSSIGNERKQEVRQELVRLNKEEELTAEVARAQNEVAKTKAKKSLEEFKKAEQTSEDAVRRVLGESPAEQSVKARIEGNTALLASLRPKLWPVLEFDPQTFLPSHLIAELRSQFQYGIKERPRVVLNVTDDGVFAAAGRETVSILLADGERKVLPPLIQAWDVPTKTVLRSWTDLEGISLRSLSLSSSQDMIYSAPDVRLFDLVSGSQTPVLSGSAVAMAPSNQILAIGSRGRALETTEVLKLVSGERLDTAVSARSEYEGWTLALAWCPDGEVLIGSFRDRLRNRLMLLDPKKPASPYLIEEQTFGVPWTERELDEVLGYEFLLASPRNEYLVVSGRVTPSDYAWKVFKLGEMAQFKTPAEKPLVQTVRRNPFVDLARPRPAFFIAGLVGKRQTLIVDQGASFAAVRMSDQVFAEFDLRRIIGGQFVTTFSADGRWLGIGDDAGRVFVLDVVRLLAGDTALPSFQAHAAPVVGLAFSPSSNILVTAAEDNAVRVWSLGGIEVESPQALLDRIEQDAKKASKRPNPRKPAPTPPPAE
jgi:WD40 repeat protein